MSLVLSLDPTPPFSGASVSDPPPPRPPQPRPPCRAHRSQFGVVVVLVAREKVVLQEGRVREDKILRKIGTKIVNTHGDPLII